MTTPERRRVRVLIVDDHPFFREGLAAWIERQASLECCGWADTPESALTAIEKDKPDVVLLDLQLRARDGMDLLTQLQTLAERPHVIVLSQKDESLFAERALRAGARGYLMKEEASMTVLAAIRAVLDGEIYVSPRLARVLLHRVGDSRATTSSFGALSDREFRVFELLGRGLNTKAIAETLGISPKTVDSYRESLKRKLRLPDGAALIRQATIWAVEHAKRS